MDADDDVGDRRRRGRRSRASCPRCRPRSASVPRTTSAPGRELLLARRRPGGTPSAGSGRCRSRSRRPTASSRGSCRCPARSRAARGSRGASRARRTAPTAASSATGSDRPAPGASHFALRGAGAWAAAARGRRLLDHHRGSGRAAARTSRRARAVRRSAMNSRSTCGRTSASGGMRPSCALAARGRGAGRSPTRSGRPSGPGPTFRIASANSSPNCRATSLARRPRHLVRQHQRVAQRVDRRPTAGVESRACSARDRRRGSAPRRSGLR